MRLFADEQKRRQLVAFGPDAEVEKNPAQSRDDDVGDFRWNSGEVDDRQRLVVNRNSQQTGDDLPEDIFFGREQELESPIVAQQLDARLETQIWYRVIGLGNPAHFLVDET